MDAGLCRKPFASAGKSCHGFRYDVRHAIYDYQKKKNTLGMAAEIGMMFVGSGAGSAAVGAGRVARGASEAAGLSPQHLYHYTSKNAAQSIVQSGLKTGKNGLLYLTNKGNLSPLQAQIELALPANRLLPNSILQIDVSGLTPIMSRRVQGNINGFGAGGGLEYLFDLNIPANLITIIK